MDAAGGDRALAAELIDVFVEDSPRRVTDLRRGVATGDAKLVRRVAHAIQEPLRFFMAQGALASELEGLAARGDLAAAVSKLDGLESTVDTLRNHRVSIRPDA